MEKILLNITNVGKSKVQPLILHGTREFTLERSPMNAVMVEKLSEIVHFSDYMKEFIQGTNPTNVISAAKPLVEALGLPCTR